MKKARLASLLILVENYAINHHVVACSDVVNPNRDTHLNSRAYHFLIERLAASGHISDRLAKTVSPRSAGLLEHDCLARRVLRDRAVAFCSSRCCGGLRHLRPCKGSHNCQGHTK